MSEEPKFEHTKEPWDYQFEDEGEYVPNIFNKETMESIFRVDSECGYLQLDEANAQRIVAVINLCAGLPVEEIERRLKGYSKFVTLFRDYFLNNMDESQCTCGAETHSDFSHEEAGCYYHDLYALLREEYPNDKEIDHPDTEEMK